VDDDLVNTAPSKRRQPGRPRHPRRTEASSVLDGAYACGSASPRDGRGVDTPTVPRSPLSPTGADVDLIVGVLPEHSSEVVT
jgi:hypothetical protein